MKAVVQRVRYASVSISGVKHASIGKGVLILLGVAKNDTEVEAIRLAEKLAVIRIFSDHSGKMNLSINDIQGETLIISQFTLLASVKKGNRPSFVDAASSDIALRLYEKFVDYYKQKIQLPVYCGVFAADMQVELLNDGPVTLIYDTDFL